ncbi:MAG: DUF1559 domain-containing protein [Pirellula sp.]
MPSLRAEKRAFFAFAMIELVVAISILVILVSLVLVGVQSAREHARRMQCQNNIRQIIIGLNNIWERHGTIPHLFAKQIVPDGGIERSFSVNPFVPIAEELSIAFKAVNRGLHLDDNYFDESYPPPVLTCPSSGIRLGYRLNFGMAPTRGRGLPNPEPLFAVGGFKQTRLVQVTDGLSNTVAIAERIPSDSEYFPRAIVQTTQANSFAEMPSFCNFSTGVVMPRQDWWVPLLEECGYEHSVSPNHRNVDCICVLSPSTRDVKFRWQIAARSFHSGVVTVAKMDSSIQAITSSIDLKTWQSLGTHHGNEVINALEVE